MSEEILDSGFKKRKPVSVFKNGLFFGTMSLLSSILMYSVFPLLFGAEVLFDKNKLSSTGFILSTICLLLPIITSLVRVAAWGKRKFHFLRVLATGLVCYQVIVIGVLVTILLTTVVVKPEKPQIDEALIRALAYGNIFVFVLAIIFWLIPGKLPYFRKQMEP